VLSARYHLLALVAVLAALLAGVVVGAGPLAARGQDRLESTSDRLRAQRLALQQERGALEAEVRARDEFVTQVAGPLTAGVLAGRTVVVLALPGAAAATVADVREAVQQAGADVVQTVTVTPTYLDPTKAASPLEDLALRLVPAGVQFPRGVSAIDRVSTVLARATVAARTEDTREVDQPAAAVLAGLTELGAVRTATDPPGRRAELAVLVAPPGRIGPAAQAEATGRAVAGLAAALDRGSRGLVVAGPGTAAAEGGVVARLRAQPAAGVSTVDLAGTPMARTVVALALAEQLRGGAGSYGTAPGAQRLLPPTAR
jgi:hypothetical protein